MYNNLTLNNQNLIKICSKISFELKALLLVLIVSLFGYYADLYSHVPFLIQLPFVILLLLNASKKLSMFFLTGFLLFQALDFPFTDDKLEMPFSNITIAISFLFMALTKSFLSNIFEQFAFKKFFINNILSLICYLAFFAAMTFISCFSVCSFASLLNIIEENFLILICQVPVIAAFSEISRN